MESIDERIHKALSSEDQVFLTRTDADGSLYRDIVATFRGHTHWLNSFGWTGALIFAVAGVGGWQFAMQTDLRSLLFLEAGTIIASLWLGMTKLWIWMELQRFWLCPPGL